MDLEDASSSKGRRNGLSSSETQELKWNLCRLSKRTCIFCAEKSDKGV